QIATDSKLRAIAVTDRQGRVVVSTEPRLESALLEGDYVRQAWKGTSSISDVYWEPALVGGPLIAYAAPIDDVTPPTGLVVLWVNSEALSTLTGKLRELAGPGSYAVVLDGH